MPAASRIGDKSQGHDEYGPTPATEGSSDVLINGIGALRVGDAFAPHEHSRVLSSGSSSVFINGKPAGRVGDDISCGDKVAEGSPNVFIGG